MSGVAGGRNARLVGLMMAMFFAFGFCTVMVDTLVPKFKAMFALSYTEVMLTQFCYFGAYFIVSLPAGWLIGAIGYLRAVALGALLMALGAAGFGPAAVYGTYPGFLAALFVLAAGVTIVQVAANPVVAVAGPAERAPARLTLAQAFNSLATTVVPLLGAWVILGHVAWAPSGLGAAGLAAFRRSEAHVFVAPAIGIAVALVVLAGVCWLARGWSPPASAPSGATIRRLLGQKRLLLGALTIFAYVGAEVSIGSSMANYLMQASVLGVAAATAGRFVSLYWGGAMLGRFVGAFVLRRLPAGVVLGCCAGIAAVLALVSGQLLGAAAAATLLAVGLFNAIQFPTIFTLAIAGLGEETPEASGVICLAIVGGAVVPLLTGYVADRAGLSTALIVPACCYVWIAAYGVVTARGWGRAATDGVRYDA